MIPRYRVWLKEEKKMLEPSDILSISFTLCEMTPNYLYGFEKEKYDFSDLELMQSTGLFDKNGQEIFEGDIVDYKGRKAIIKWHGSYASFIYRFVDEMQERVSEWDPLFLAYHHFEIIGNVYENQELLEVE